MFCLEAKKIPWIVLLSILYFVVLALVLILHFTAESVNTNVTKFTMPILIFVITIVWIVIGVFLIQKRTILINENGFSFKRLRKTVNYSWADVDKVEISKAKKENYIIVTFSNGKTYGTEYAEEIENIIRKYFRSNGWLDCRVASIAYSPFNYNYAI